MLIYTSKHPGWGKQKPQQWGPLSSVRSALYYNAERMGIDPAKIAGAFPFWEGSGDVTRNLIDPAFVLNRDPSALWTNDGIETVRNEFNDNPWGAASPLIGGVDELTFIIPEFTANYLEPGLFLIGQVSPNTLGYDWGFYYSGTSGWNAYVETGSVKNVVGAPMPSNGQTYTGGGIYTGSNISLIYNGDIIGSVAQTGTTVSTEPLTFGAWAKDTIGITYRSAYVFKQALNATQVAQLHEAPYTLLQPSPQRTYFIVSAAPPATTNTRLLTLLGVG